jgi:hypothetical protein
MVDFFASDIVDAFARDGCPLCRSLEQAEVTLMESFVREGRKAREARSSFFDAGGFCRRHAWLFHRLAESKGSGVPIADVYSRLLQHDLELIRELEADISTGARGRRRRARLRRHASCPACEWRKASIDRKVAFMVDALRSRDARARYRASEGPCYPHLVAAVEQALETDQEVAQFLLSDFRTRLERLAHQLAEFDRKRDHRYANEPRGAEQDSWTEVVRRYVGENSSLRRVG